MNRWLCLVAVVLSITCGVKGNASPDNRSRVIPLPGIVKPAAVFCDAEHLYITENVSVNIYSLKDFTLIRKFGREGEGPGEFKIRPDQPLALCVRPDGLVVAVVGRLLFFTKLGGLKREIKISPTYFMALQAYGDRYIGIGTVNEDKGFLALNIYDRRLKKVNELYRIEEELIIEGKKGVYRYLQVPSALATSFASYREKIYLTWGTDDTIKIFDKTGKKTGTIPLKTEKIKLTADYKKRIQEHFQNDRSIPRPIIERFYKNIRFPEYFPAIRDMRIADGRIFIVTFRNKAAQTRCLLYSLNGKLESDVYLPLIERDAVSLYPFAIGSGKLYQLVENNDEEFDLHITAIE